MIYDRFYPGKVWLDTDGNRIQAHGGSVIVVDDTFYWYGENKEKTDGKNEGIIIPPEPDKPDSPLYPSACMDRPHIIYNQKTGKYVCWLKIMNRDKTQSETILTADKILGPYTIVREGLRPLGMSAGDFDLAVAEDGKAYYYFERVHSETICADLTEDYTDVTGYYSTHFPNGHPPYVREAPAHFTRKGKHYLLTSGTTGYLPNPSQVAIADTWHGPYTVIGDPHVGDISKTSFHTQVSSVFKVPGKKDLYIACADRWLPEEMDRKYEDYEQMFNAIFEPENYSYDFSKEKPPVENTFIADYVWLPLRFIEADEEHPLGRVLIEWKDEWKLSDFEDIK